MYKVLLPILLLYITSCITPSKKMITTIDGSKNEGMIVGTISIENRPFFATGYFFYYVNDSVKNPINGKDENSLKPDPTPNKQNRIAILNADPDFKEGKKWYYLFNIVNKEGKYKFHRIEIYSNSGTMESTVKIPFKLPFKIESGKVNYIGEINFKAKNGAVEVIDNIERDRKIFKEKFPNLSF